MTGPLRTGLLRTGLVGQVKLEQFRSCTVKSGLVKLGQVKSGQVKMHLRIEFDSGVGPITGSALHNTPKLVGFYMGYYIVYNPNDNTTSTL